MEGECFYKPSEFPDELKKLFEQGFEESKHPNIFVGNNNWLETFVYHKGILIDSFVEEDEELEGPTELFNRLYTNYKWYSHEGYTFGAHPEDPSNFGWWPNEMFK